MKRIYKLLIVLLCTFFSISVFGHSIIFHGFACQNATNPADPTPTAVALQSRFEVVEDLGGGMYVLHLTGGLPRFVDGQSDICIDHATAIGFTGIPQRDGIPVELDSIDAIAYFNGKELIVTVNSIFTDLSSSRGTFSSFSTSRVQPYANTLIFDLDIQNNLFRLKKLIHNRGLVHTSGSTASVTPFLETVIPSLNDAPEDFPKVLTPAVNIEYRPE